MEAYSRFYGATPDYGWRDITGEIETRGVGATDPAWAQIGAGPFFAYKFDLNDVCWMAFHIPHDIAMPKPDGVEIPVHLHVHWLSDGTNVNKVKWQFEYSYAKGHNQQSFDATGTTVTAEQAGYGAAYRHMVTETDAISIDGLEPDGIIYVKITRIANGGTDNTDGIFVLTADIHYQSTSHATPNRAPNFWE